MASDDNTPLAFLVVTLAGLSTTFGAALVFHRRFVSLANPLFLAASLGASAGVMLHVSLVEILGKAGDAFAETSLGDDPKGGAVYATATSCFFGGIFLCAGLRMLVHRLDKSNYESYHHGEEVPDPTELDRRIELTDARRGGATRMRTESPAPGVGEFDAADGPRAPAGAAAGQDGAQVEVEVEVKTGADGEEPVDLEAGSTDGAVARRRPSATHEVLGGSAEPVSGTSLPVPLAKASSAGAGDAAGEKAALEQRRLQRMGLMTALAIGVHNFPEGLATFVATLSDTKVGIALAVAIAVHNIPEVRGGGVGWVGGVAHSPQPVSPVA